MFKPAKIAAAVAVSALLASCANLDTSYDKSQQTFQQYEALTQQFSLNQDWWKLYNDQQLNDLVDLALKNNKDLAKAAIAVNLALYKANLIGQELVPNFSGSTKSTAAKNIRTGGNTAPTGQFIDNSVINHTGSVQVGYTLDLWQRLRDQASSAEWEHSASVSDLHAAKLSLVNAVVTTYYKLAYLQEAVKITESSVADYEEINNIMKNKWKAGVVDKASTTQTERAVLTAKHNLNDLRDQQKMAQAMMRNLLNLKPTEKLPVVHYPNLLKVTVPGVNLDVPMSVIANRPDVRSKLYKLNSAFKNAKATQKSWFPNITLGASLTSSGNRPGNALHTPIAAGLLGIDLPFLSWNTVRWNVKMSESAYNLARVNFEQSITTALNDIDKNYFAYQTANKNLANEESVYKTNQYMAEYYKNRYNVGVTELRDWLAAKSTEKISQLAVLGAKVAVIQNENAVYSAMGGYYSKDTKNNNNNK